MDLQSQVSGKRKRVDSDQCDQCEYTGSRAAVKHHKESKHDGIRYPCDQCEFNASSSQT